MNAAGLSTGLAAYRAESMAVPVENAFFQRRWARWGLFIAFWTFLGLFNAGQSYIIRRIALDLPFKPRRRHCYRRRGLVLVGGASFP